MTAAAVTPREEFLADRLESIERQLTSIANQIGVVRLEPWLTKRQLAEYLAVSPRWIDDRRAEGMPCRPLAGANKFRISEVEPWLRKHGFLEEGQ